MRGKNRREIIISYNEQMDEHMENTAGKGESAFTDNRKCVPYSVCAPSH